MNIHQCTQRYVANSFFQNDYYQRPYYYHQGATFPHKKKRLIKTPNKSKIFRALENQAFNRTADDQCQIETILFKDKNSLHLNGKNQKMWQLNHRTMHKKQKQNEEFHLKCQDKTKNKSKIKRTTTSRFTQTVSKHQFPAITHQDAKLSKTSKVNLSVKKITKQNLKEESLQKEQQQKINVFGQNLEAKEFANSKSKKQFLQINNKLNFQDMSSEDDDQQRQQETFKRRQNNYVKPQVCQQDRSKQSFQKANFRKVQISIKKSQKKDRTSTTLEKTNLQQNQQPQTLLENSSKQQQDIVLPSPPATSNPRIVSTSEFIRQFVVSKIKNQQKEEQEYLKKPLNQNISIDFLLKRFKPSKSKQLTQFHLHDAKTLKQLVIVIKNSDYRIYAKSNIMNAKEHPQKKYLTAKVSSNFLGNQFKLEYISQQQSAVASQNHQKLAGNILYETNILGSSKPRKIVVQIPQTSTTKCQSQDKITTPFPSQQKLYQQFINKPSKWNDISNSYSLNMQGKAKMASVKNFIIVRQKQNHESCTYTKQDSKVIFGKVNSQIFNLTIKGPFSILQGLSLALSSFERKIACD